MFSETARLLCLHFLFASRHQSRTFLLTNSISLLSNSSVSFEFCPALDAIRSLTNFQFESFWLFSLESSATKIRNLPNQIFSVFCVSEKKFLLEIFLKTVDFVTNSFKKRSVICSIQIRLLFVRENNYIQKIYWKHFKERWVVIGFRFDEICFWNMHISKHQRDFRIAVGLGVDLTVLFTVEGVSCRRLSGL